MTALAGTAVRRPTARPAHRWGATRTVLRLHRTSLLVWGAAVLVLSGWMVWLTEVAASDEARANEACAVRDACDAMAYRFGYSGPIALTGALLGYSFLAVAAFAGGALTGRELESGTARLAWTQSVTPTRWLAAKLAVPALALALGTTVLTLVFRWSWAAHPDLVYGEWSQSDIFVTRGPAAVAYVLCALAVGALTGLLLRRALPALGVSAAVMLVLALVLQNVRRYLWPAEHRVTAQDAGPDPHVWQLGTDVLVHGRPAPGVTPWTCEGATEELRHCYDRLGITGFSSTYHPQSHYLPLSLVESGILLALAALAATAAFRLLRRRTA